MTKKILSIVSEIISWFTLAVLVFCIAALLITKLSGGVPEIFGFRIFVIATGSMSPTLEVGDVILSKCYDNGDELEIGDILTYEGAGDTEGYLITHRLVSIEDDSGEKMLILRGDANNISDSAITEDRVIGVTLCKLRLFGAVYSLMHTKWGMPILIAIIMFFIIKEALEFRKSLEIQKKTDEQIKSVNKDTDK